MIKDKVLDESASLGEENPTLKRIVDEILEEWAGVIWNNLTDEGKEDFMKKKIPVLRGNYSDLIILTAKKAEKLTREDEFRKNCDENSQIAKNFADNIVKFVGNNTFDDVRAEERQRILKIIDGKIVLLQIVKENFVKIMNEPMIDTETVKQTLAYNQERIDVLTDLKNEIAILDTEKEVLREVANELRPVGKGRLTSVNLLSQTLPSEMPKVKSYSGMCMKCWYNPCRCKNEIERDFK